jgi:hypothetical protein
MAIYEFLIRGNIDGQVTGGHVLRFGPQGEIGPAGLSALTPEELAQIPEWAIELMASSDNSQTSDPAQITQLQQQIATLQLEASPAISEITPALMDAGLLAWGERATMANSEAVLALVIELRDTAMAPRSIAQCDRIKDIFGKICSRSGVVPTPAEAQAMQAILDVGPPSTGQIAAKYLSFAPWM